MDVMQMDRLSVSISLVTVDVTAVAEAMCQEKSLGDKDRREPRLTCASLRAFFNDVYDD